MVKSPLTTGSSVEKHDFPCRGCGADLEFKPGAGRLVCPYCGREQKIEKDEGSGVQEHSFDEALADAKTKTKTKTLAARELAEDGKEVRCRGCGAVTVVSGQASRCPFCDSPVVLEVAEESIIEPESLLPFTVGRRQAGERFVSWVKSRWFAPGDLALRARKEGMDGVYLPYWIYDSDTRADYKGERGTYTYATEQQRNNQGKSVERQVRKTSWHPVSGTARTRFDDVLVCASTSLPQQLVRGLEPWDLKELHPFQPSYLSGFAAERYSVGLEEGFKLAEARMAGEIETTVRREIGGDEQRITSMHVQHTHVRFKHTLFPLWISSFRYKSKIYRFIVNARTGEPTGERPMSTAKIIMTVLAALAAVGILFLVL